jgi:hypothetical protein
VRLQWRRSEGAAQYDGHRMVGPEQLPTIVGDRALSAFGRLRVMMPTDPRTCMDEAGNNYARSCSSALH